VCEVWEDVFAGTITGPREKLQSHAEGIKAFLPLRHSIFSTCVIYSSRITNDWPRRTRVMCRLLFPVAFAVENSVLEASRSTNLSATGDGKRKAIWTRRKIKPSTGKNQPIIDREIHRQCIQWVLKKNRKHASLHLHKFFVGINIVSLQ